MDNSAWGEQRERSKRRLRRKKSGRKNETLMSENLRKEVVSGRVINVSGYIKVR